MLDRLVNLAAHGDDGGLCLIVAQVHRLEGGVRNRPERVLRPLGKEVDRAVVDEGGEIAEARVEELTARRHAQAQVDVGAHALDKVGVERNLVEGQVERLANWPHRPCDPVYVVVVKEVGHIARVEQVVHVLEERLLHDLRVAQQEDQRLALLASLEECLLEVVAPLDLAVGLRDFDLKAVKLGHRRCQPRQGLAARAADAQKQGVAARLSEDTGDARDVRDGIDKHDERHLLRVCCVVVVEALFHDRHHPRRVGDLCVHPRLRARHHEVAVQQLRHVHLDHIAPGRVLAENLRHQPL
mmetsp:Transcript_13845/g.40763  ORF Transcript_13845/g.40763 Transcript_13845/m.40763 type:complete len:298 (+) Transcript_13845:1709-2602(+)